MTKTELYQEIKRRIVFLEYAPGQDLVMQKLAKEFGVSITPIREVLVRLEAERLVRLTPNKGAFVTEVSLQDLRDMLELRLLLMGAAGRWAAQRASEEELKAMELLLKEMKRIKRGRSLVEMDFEFHNLINRAAKNRELAWVLENLRSHMFRLWTFIGVDKQESYSPKIVEDFERLLAALKDRDAARAEEVLREHVTTFIELVQLSLLNLDPLCRKGEAEGQGA